MAIGRAGTPIDFQAIDGRPVSIIWMLASPPDKTGPHIHALARISRLMTIDKFRAALLQAKTPQEAYDIIIAQENAL
jgi:mannitol/fructose-specific phosphotransferase system IIA component (Ntr-type)